MAVVSEPDNAPLSVHTGPFGALAQLQYSALTSMRWAIFRNSLRSNHGTMELGARTISFLLYAIMGIALGAGMGGGAYAIVAKDKLAFLPALFWVVFVLWQILPVSLASFQEQFDMGGLLRFPVGFGSFFLLHLIFGLVDISTILGGLCCFGIWVGITAARPGLSAWAALALLVFAAFNVLLVRAIFAWIDRWLAQRKTREIFGAVFFLLLLSLQFLNPAFYGNKHGKMSAQTREASMHALQVANSVQRWLPPGLASAGVTSAARRQAGEAVEGLGILGLYVLAAGGVLALRLRAEYRGENLGQAPSRKKAERHSGQWLIDGSGPIAAVMEKELRTLLRSLPLLYGVGAPLFMVIVLSGLFHKTTSIGGHPLPMALLISLAYVMVGFTQLFYNNLGVEGTGIQILFLSPTPVRTVLLAKNLFYALLFAIDAALVCLLASLRYGLPTPIALAATLAWVSFALPVNLAVGNLFSLTMPYRINLGRIGRQRGAQASGLLSMLIQVGVLAVGAAVFALCTLFDKLWLAIPVFLVLALGAVFAWMRILANADLMANQRRDHLISTLVKTE